jgi:hypothetical protein
MVRSGRLGKVRFYLIQRGLLGQAGYGRVGSGLILFGRLRSVRCGWMRLDMVRQVWRMRSVTAWPGRFRQARCGVMNLGVVGYGEAGVVWNGEEHMVRQGVFRQAR